MKKIVLCMALGVLVFFFAADLDAMECRVVDDAGNPVYYVNAGDLVYFQSVYLLSKSRKLTWNLMVTLPTLDKTYFRTTVRLNGHFYQQWSFDNKYHFVPVVIPTDSFIEGIATFKYSLTGNKTCYVYVHVSQQDTVAPSVPTLTAAAASSSQINLSWTASTDNVGVTGYYVYSGAGTYLRNVAGTSTSFTGLNPNTQYCYKVKAYDAAGNESQFSNTACATTGQPPVVPQPGTWRGSVVSFNVSSSGTSLTPSGSSLYVSGQPQALVMLITGYNCDAMTIAAGDTIPINNNAFSRSGTFPDGSRFSVSGTFTGNTSASGSYSYTGVGRECSGSGNWVTNR